MPTSREARTIRLFVDDEPVGGKAPGAVVGDVVGAVVVVVGT